MKALLVGIFLLFVACCQQIHGSEITQAPWTGILDAAGEIRFVRLKFTEADGRLNGVLQDPEAVSSKPLPLQNIELTKNSLRFDIVAGEHKISCSANLKDGTLVSEDKACILKLVFTPEYPEESKLVGAYRADDGSVLSITSLADFPQLTICDYQTGMWRNLYHRGSGKFTAGSGISIPLPVTYTVVASGNSITIESQDEKPIVAKRISFREQPVTWKNGEAELHGTLILPEGKGPFPALVLTQMSSPAPRDAYRLYGYFFVSHGLAALIYDRRGLGESKGDTTQTGMIELAQDAVEGAHALQKMPEIDAKRVGAWGHSQGGWIAPFAAAQSTDIAFVISQSGPAVTAAEQEIFRVENNARDAGLTDDEVQAAVAYEKLLMNWVKTGEGREQIHATSKASMNERWARFVELREDLPEHPSARSQKFWYLDPAPELAKLRVPILAIYGSRDAYVPVEKSVVILKESLAKAGNQNASIVILPDAAHGLWGTTRDSYRNLTQASGFHKDYWPTLLNWLNVSVVKN